MKASIWKASAGSFFWKDHGRTEPTTIMTTPRQSSHPSTGTRPSRLHSTFCCAVAAIAFAHGAIFALAAEDKKADAAQVQLVSDDATRGGGIDRKVELRIANPSMKSNTDVLCVRWILGHTNWSVRFVSVKIDSQPHQDEAEVLAQAVAESALAAERFLNSRFASGPVQSIELAEQGMPTFFTQSLYRALATQMHKSPGVAQAAYDRRLKKMLQTAIEKNEFVGRIVRRLKELGIPLQRLTHHELIATRTELIGKPWRTIAGEQTAGLKSGSATVLIFR